MSIDRPDYLVFPLDIQGASYKINFQSSGKHCFSVSAYGTGALFWNRAQSFYFKSSPSFVIFSWHTDNIPDLLGFLTSKNLQIP